MKPMLMILVALMLAAPLAGSTALAQEEEIPVIFDRSYLERHSVDHALKYLDFGKREIAISPDGQWIAFVSGPNSYEIWIVPIEGGEPTRVHVVPDDQLLIIPGVQTARKGSLSSIGFTPDGEEITFCRHYYDAEKGSLWTYTVDDQSKSFRARNSIPTIESVNIATGEVHSLVEEGSDPGWSADGRYLTYIHHDHMVWFDPSQAQHHGVPAILDTETGETQYLDDVTSTLTYADPMSLDARIVSGTSYTNPVMSEDNSVLYCSAHSYDDGGNNPLLVGIDLESGERTFFADIYPDELQRVPGGRYLVYTEFTGTLRCSNLFDTQTNETVWAIQGLGTHHHSGVITPGGNSIIYLKEYDFSYTTPDGTWGCRFGNATMICRQPIDITERFATGNTVPPPEVASDYGVLPEYGTMVSALDIGDVYTPAWSPDGQSIAFLATFDKQIWTGSVTGDEQRLVYQNPSIMYQGRSTKPPIYNICGYTPDGDEILFVRAAIDEARNSAPVVTEISSRWSNPLTYLYAVDVETGEVRTVVEGAAYGLYSPDGKYLAYVINHRNVTGDLFLDGHNHQLVIRDLETGVETFHDIWDGNDIFAWKSDGNAVLADADKGKPSVIPLDGSAPYRLKNALSYAVYALSPVDDRCYVYNEMGTRNLKFRNLETGDTELFSPDVAGIFSDPAFSPDGSRLACIITFDGPDISDPYGIDKRRQLFILDKGMPFIKIPTMVEDAAPAAELVIANFPNPFNPSTTITFALPGEGMVSLDIYSLSGQKVRGLVNDHLAAGVHEVVWDGRGDSGMTLASGIYIARITAGSSIVARRMLLMK